MVQAPVRALDPDGMAVVSAGTIAFAIGAVICWLARADLVAIGKLWYLGVSITGTLLGLLGLAFGLYRKARRRHQQAARSVEEPLLHADGVPDRE
jgi:bacteriorhodopsin